MNAWPSAVFVAEGPECQFVGLVGKRPNDPCGVHVHHARDGIWPYVLGKLTHGDRHMGKMN